LEALAVKFHSLQNYLPLLLNSIPKNVEKPSLVSCSLLEADYEQISCQYLQNTAFAFII
jgi:hypothetical protein